MTKDDDDFARKHARRDNFQTSHDAAASVKEVAKQQKARVLWALETYGPMTSEEIEQKVGFACWRRVSDLKNEGKIVWTGETRAQSSGKQANVWRVVEGGEPTPPKQKRLFDD